MISGINDKDFILCVFEAARLTSKLYTLFAPVEKLESKHFIQQLNFCLVSLKPQITNTVHKLVCLTVSVLM